jgi:two-component system, OmpR family, alkaline phosphatase synthesis response regulator PhoP
VNDDKKRILVIEDDESISLGLRINLEAEGYEVIVASDGEAGLAAAREDGVSLLILDVMLPKENGFEVLRKLRHEGYATPVILLSARGAELDKVMGLELGAEDYITKPFSLAELLARVKVQLRRQKPQPRVVKAGELRIEIERREVTRGGEAVPLTATELDVLLCLIRAEGQPLSREDILRLVWGPGHHGTLRTIDNFLLQLRTKLEADPSEPQHLLTVRGVGYRWED